MNSTKHEHGKPQQIIKAPHLGDMSFSVLSDTHIVLYRTRIFEKQLLLTVDWAKEFTSLNMTLPVKDIVTSRQKGRWRVSVLDSSNTLVSLTLNGKVEDRSVLGAEISVIKIQSTP